MREGTGIVVCSSLTAAFLIISGPTLAGPQSGASVCRDRAQELRNAATRCRSRLASGELDSCAIRVTFRKDTRISIGEAERLANEFEWRARQFETSERQAQAFEEAQSKVRNLKEQVEQDQRAIQNLGLRRRAEDFEAWMALSEEAKEAFETETLDALMTTTLLNVQAGTKKVGSLSPPKANSYISRLRSKGVDEPYLFDAIRGLSRVQGRPQLARRVNIFLDQMSKAKDSYSMAKGISQESLTDYSAKLEALGTVLGWAVEDPGLTFLVAEIRWTSASLYNNLTRRVAKDQIETMTNLTEEQLKALKRLTEVLRGHVQQLGAARMELAKLPEPRPGFDACN